MKKTCYLLFSAFWFFLLGMAPTTGAQSLKPGTQIRVRLLGRLDTGQNQAGQTFSATVGEAVRSGNRILIAKNTRVNGQIIEVVSSGRLKRPASISLQLTSIGKQTIHTEALQIDGKSHAGRDTALIGGGAAAGAIIGAIAGGGKGAAIGTLAGAGAGTGTAYATGKQEIVLPAETELVFVVAGNDSTASQAPPRPADPAPPARSEVYGRPEPSRPSDTYAYRGGDRDDDDDYDRREDRWRDEPEHDGRSYAVLIFTERDQRIIRSYFRSNREDLPPGLAKRNGDLPPGLEKHLRRDGTLPPGLQKRAERFPEDLDDRLSPLPRGYSRVVVSGRALILSRDGRIADVIEISY